MSGLLVPETRLAADSSLGHHQQLLGELRRFLESENDNDEARRGLLAALDRLLAVSSGELMSLERRHSPPPPKFLEPLPSFFADPMQLFHKLQRLRDRLAHRTPFAMLANEIRLDLQRLLHQRPVESAGEIS